MLLPKFHFTELTIPRILHIHAEFPHACLCTYINCLGWLLENEINYSHYFKFCFFFSSYVGSLCFNCLTYEMDKMVVCLSWSL